MNDLAISQIGRLDKTLNQPFDLKGIPGAVNSVDPRNLVESYGQRKFKDSFAPSGKVTNDIANAGQIRRSVGPTDYSDDRRRVEDAIMSRYDEGFARDEAAMDAKLAAQGLVPGTEAYNEQATNLGKQKNDARMQAILAGGSEQSRLADLAFRGGEFENAAQAQQFGQNAARSQFGNEAQAQRFGQNAATSAFYNDTQDRRMAAARELAGFTNAARTGEYNMATSSGNFRNTARQNAINERLAVRNQPINEISALLGGGQVTAPAFKDPTTQGVDSVPIGDYINNNYNQQMANSRQNMSGLFGLGGNIISGLFGLSDVRAKKDIKRVGKTDSGKPIYKFRYKSGGPVTLGLMAQELEETNPEAVITSPEGVKYIDYAQVA